MWYDGRYASLLLRLAGVGLLVFAWFAGYALFHRTALGSIDRDAIAFLLAALIFLLGSAGAALALLGRHLFDRVELARQWSRTGE